MTGYWKPGEKEEWLRPRCTCGQDCHERARAAEDLLRRAAPYVERVDRMDAAKLWVEIDKALTIIEKGKP